MRRFAITLLALFLTSVLAGCGIEVAPQPNTPASSGDNEVTVYAAASLTEAFQDIAAAFTNEYPGAKVVFSFGGSNQLRSQIEQGAPAGIFASANEKEMNALVQQGMISGEPAIFARNRLVVIVPKANPGKIKTVHDLANTGISFIATGPTVPAGAYWLQSLDKISADPAFGAGFKDAVTRNFISEETDVKQVVAKIQLGEGDAGVVYLSDVTPKVAPDVQMIEIPQPLNVVAEYPIAIIDDGEVSPLETDFVSFVLSDNGQSILEKHRFLLGN